MMKIEFSKDAVKSIRKYDAKIKSRLKCDQNLAYELIKKIVLAWDPDYSKLTPAEEKELEEIHTACESGEVYSYDQVWE